MIRCAWESKVSLQVINRLDASSQPQILELPVEQDRAGERLMRHNMRNLVQIVSCKNLLAVLFKDNIEGHKVFLYNGENETWLSDLDSSAVTGPRFCPLDTAICRNLLDVTVSFPNAAENKTFFWQLNACQPADTSPQFVGAMLYPNSRQVSVLFVDWGLVHLRYRVPDH